MLTKAGVIVVPKYIEQLVREQVSIFIRPKPYSECAANVARAIQTLREFCTKHHHDFELVHNQFDDLADRKNLRKKFATVRMYGTIAQKFEKIIKEAQPELNIIKPRP